MIFAVYICISFIMLGLSWFLYRRNFEMFLCLLIVIYYEFFYIFPLAVGYKYILLPIVFILFTINLIKGNLSLNRYGLWIIGYLAISWFSIVVAYFAGQDIILGIKAAKFIPLVLIYFVVVNQKIDLYKFLKYFLWIGLGIAALCAVFSLTHASINPFLGMPKDFVSNQAGRLRITIGQFVISAAALMAYAAYLKGKGIGYLAAAAGLFLEVIMIQQTRGFIAGIVLSGIFINMVSRKLTAIRLSLGLTILGSMMIAMTVLSYTDLTKIEFFKRIDADLKKTEGSYGGSIQARIDGYKYYSKVIEKNLMTGRGLLNFNWSGNTERYLQEYHSIHLSDIGIMHFFVQSGLVGILWFFYGFIKLIKHLLMFREFLPLGCYFILGALVLPTLDMFLDTENSLFLFAIILGVFTKCTEISNGIKYV